MKDQYFDRTYHSGRAELNAGLDRAFATIGRSVNSTFGALHRVQFAAPWTKRRTDVGCA